MTVTENTIAYQVTIHTWGIERKVPKAILKQMFPDEQERNLVEGNMLKASKRIIESKEYDRITKRDTKATTWLKEHSVPSMLRRGVYCIPVTYCEIVDAYMEDYKSDRSQRVADFLVVYREQAYAARDALGEALFSTLEYPSEERMKALFSVETAYIVFDVPRSLAFVNEELFKREKEKLDQTMQEAERAINDLLIAECAKLVSELRVCLSGLSDGTLKRFRDANVQNLLEWADIFLQARNVTNNTELEAVVQSIKATLQGVTRDELKYNSGGIREAVQHHMAGIQVELKGMMEEQEREVYFNVD